MNAIATCQPHADDDNGHMLQELIACGMQLARAAARKALQALEAPAAAEIAAANARARGPDPSLLFLRLWGSIRQSITLHARLGLKPKPQADTNTAVPGAAPDPAAAERLRERMNQLGQEIGRSGKAAARYTTALSPTTRAKLFQPAVPATA